MSTQNSPSSSKQESPQETQEGPYSFPYEDEEIECELYSDTEHDEFIAIEVDHDTECYLYLFVDSDEYNEVMLMSQENYQSGNNGGISIRYMVKQYVERWYFLEMLKKGYIERYTRNINKKG
jgi:hypothetical protein